MGALLGTGTLGAAIGEGTTNDSIADAAANAVGKSSISPFVGMQMDAWDMFSQMFNAEQQRVNPTTAAPAPSAGAPENPTATKPTDTGTGGTTGSDPRATIPSRDYKGNMIYITPEEAAAAGGDNVTWGYADGGTVQQPNALQKLFPQNIWNQTRNTREQNAGTQSPEQPGGGITINVNASPAPAPTPAPATQETDVWTKMLEEAKKRGYADGTTSAQPRSVKNDIKSGGKIGGPQSKDGRDNQFIKVAGGEGILPVDVMQVPGVEELVHELIATYHTPVNK